MKVTAYTKVPTELEIDIPSVAKQLISSHIETIIGNLIYEFVDNPAKYIGGDIDDEAKTSISELLREEISKLIAC